MSVDQQHPPVRSRATTTHRRRTREGPPLDDPDATPQLAEAWHSLALHWLREYPAYRAEIERRVARAVEIIDDAREMPRCVECGGEISPRRFTDGCGHCLDRQRKQRERDRATDFDHLGREIEACG